MRLAEFRRLAGIAIVLPLLGAQSVGAQQIFREWSSYCTSAASVCANVQLFVDALGIEVRLQNVSGAWAGNPGGVLMGFGFSNLPGPAYSFSNLPTAPTFNGPLSNSPDYFDGRYYLGDIEPHTVAWSEFWYDDWGDVGPTQGAFGIASSCGRSVLGTPVGGPGYYYQPGATLAYFMTAACGSEGLVNPGANGGWVGFRTNVNWAWNPFDPSNDWGAVDLILTGVDIPTNEATGGGYDRCGSGDYYTGPACTQVVPEPGTWILLLTGLLGIGIVFRKRSAALRL